LNNVQSVDEFLKENPGNWDLVVIDTLARCMSGDENSTPDMNMAVAECDRIRRKAGGDLILVHHQGWSKARPRGASALFGALDGLIRVYRNPERYTVVEVEALREGAVNERAGALYRLIDGVMEPIAPKPKGVDKLQGRERNMLEVLDTLCGATGGAVPTKQWREAVESMGPPVLDGKTKKVRDQQWRRAFANLTEVETIKVYGSDVLPWRPSDDFKEEGVEDE
jgi:AAA domain